MDLIKLRSELIKYSLWENKTDDKHLIRGIVNEWMDLFYPTWRNCLVAAEEFQETCPECEGKKRMAYSCCTGLPVIGDLMMCPVCKEHLGEEACYTCGGTGVIYKEYE